jgi:DNA-binding NarL/FixJ family response regulator
MGMRVGSDLHVPQGWSSRFCFSGDQVATKHVPKPVRIGLFADEPMRLEGLISIFEAQSEEGPSRITPVTGTLKELLSCPLLEILVFDMDSSSGGLQTLEVIRRERPEIRLIVLGPEGNDELVLEAITAGARAYVDFTAELQVVRSAIQTVSEGSIWAPRRLLSKLIDRLLSVRDSSLTNTSSHLTARESEVLGLILMARSNREIARQLGIEERTVKAHVGRLMRKTGVDNRIELSMHAISRSMIQEPKMMREGKMIREGKI